jgi:hypothetical protein
MDLLTALVVLVAGTLMYAWLASPRTDAALDALGAGFLPYREAGWPRGVQEGEPIPWKWESMSERGIAPADRAPAPDAGVEIIEIDGESGAELTGIHRGQISGGTTIRPH